MISKKTSPGKSLAEANPELAKEWHPTKNNFFPSDVKAGSGKKAWWKCPKGNDHEWEARIGSRLDGNGCPICANKVAVQSNSLATLNPQLAKEWHPIKNNDLTPNDVTPGSHIKVWWKCPKGEDHEWKATIKDRNVGRGCSVCASRTVVISNSLATLNPGLAKEWHPTKNNNLTPQDVVPSSNKNVWWKCSKAEDHEWKARVNDRNRRDGCPFCSNRKILNSNSLSTLYPHLAREWHPTRNGDLTPNDISPGSQKRVWWKCNKGIDHEWRTSSAKRISGTNCPVCANKIVVPSNSLATLNPILAKEWHTTKNKNLTPSDVVPGSNKNVWWKCSKGEDHEWKASVNERSSGRGCSVCANRTVTTSNSLATLNPKLTQEWHPTKNGKLTPKDVHPGSNEKVWWKCSKGEDHVWQASILNRSKGTGCTICSNRKIIKTNSLATLNPGLAKEWHPIKNGNLTPDNVGAGSGKKVWWKCFKGVDHEWESSISSRQNGIGCPICSNRKIVKSNCLAIVDPVLAKEWHPAKNGKLTPYDIGAGSSKKVWWKCRKSNDHAWETSVDHRKRGRGCPFCTNPSSVPELRIFSELKTIFPSIRHRVILKGYEVDIYIPELQIGIEYDGEYWHRNKKQKDLEKNLALNSTILLIRIREKGLSKLTNTDIELKTTNISVELTKKILKSILEHRQIESLEILERIKKYFKYSDWIASDHFKKLNSEKKHIGFEKSISYLFPDVAKEWHPTKNDPLLPEFFTPGSSRKVWWKCPKGEDHEWASTISNRILGRKCPVCANRRIQKSNSLAILSPRLTKEWHPTKNGELTPYDVGVGSNKKIWWRCLKGEDHEWQATIVSRRNGVGCPICSNKKIINSNSLATINPILAKQWHPTKNGALTPFDVSPGSHKKVWWKCPKGEDHEWQAIVKSRKRGTGCSMCANKIIVKSNCLATLNPQLTKEWHPNKNGDLTPKEVHPGSIKKVWWLGKCGHEWQAVIHNRALRKYGCPKCRNKRISQTRRRNKKSPGQLDLI